MSGYIEGTKNQFRQRSADLQNFQYECAWRLGQWSSGEDDCADSKNYGSAFSRHRFLALDSLLGENGNESEFDRHLKLANDEVTDKLLRLNHFDSACSAIAEPLTHLRALRELLLISELMPRIQKSHEIDRNLSARVAENLEQVTLSIKFRLVSKLLYLIWN
jgi:hypothetical protein